MNAPSPSSRAAQLDALGNDVFDVIVLGGGITGVTAAHELTRRGYRTALVDNHDFASGTSQESSQLIWGGIKYLEQGQWKLVNKLCRARNEFVRDYPDRVAPLNFLYPHYDHSEHLLPTVMAGAYAYWVIGRGFGVFPKRHRAEAIQRLIPRMRISGFTRGLEYTDATMIRSDARLTLDFLFDAVAAGLTAVNYLDFTAAERSNAKGLHKLELTDTKTGSRITAQARWLVNATGVWVDEVNRRLDLRAPHALCFSKGVHLIIPRIETGGRAVTCLAADGRIFFVIPWGEVTMIGTTDTPFEEAPHRVKADADDINYLRSECEAKFDIELGEDDVLNTKAGLRPLLRPENAGHADFLALARSHKVWSEPSARVTALWGGKYTDSFLMAGEIADEVGIEPSGSRRLVPAAPMSSLVEMLQDANDFDHRILVEACRQESVMTLEDLLRRRTSIGLKIKNAGWGAGGGNETQIRELASAVAETTGRSIDEILEEYEPRPSRP